jgi:hypothetical protein
MSPARRHRLLRPLVPPGSVRGFCWPERNCGPRAVERHRRAIPSRGDRFRGIDRRQKTDFPVQASTTPSLRNWLSASRRAFRDGLHDFVNEPYLPRPTDERDLFIVAYPKSGSTWLSYLMANANLLLSGERRQATFFNLNDFVADLHRTRRIGPETTRAPGCRCFKSHARWIRRYRKVVYLVRDPRPVMASYHQHLGSRGVFRGSIEAMVRHPDYGIASWIDHVGGWLDRVDAGVSFTLLRYEDLRRSPAGELMRLYALLGWDLDSALAGEAVERSSLARMRLAEGAFNAGHPRRMGAEHVRRSDIDGPRQPIPVSALRLIEAGAGSLMRRLGYGED